MLVFTEEVGQPVVDGLGRAAGRAVELVVRADDPLARVARIGIRRHRQPLRWVEWRDVLTFEKSGVQLCPEAVIRASDEPGSSTDLWLRRDVLDTQILDAQGGRLDALSHAQLAALVAQVPSARASELLSAVGPHRAADALSLAHPDVSSRLVGALPHPFATKVLEHMPSDDAASALRKVPRDQRTELLGDVTSARAEELRRLLAAPPDTAQGLMSTDVRLAGPGDSLAQIREALTAHPPRMGGLANVFVVDELGRPLGMIDTVALITGFGARQQVPSIPADAPIGDVIDLFATHDFLALPVVDIEGRVIGAIAIDDVLEELVAERMPGRSNFRHYVGRHRLRRTRVGRRARG